jgi:hypothetical protein
MSTSYTPYYSGGWQSGEEGNTPITPDALNHMDEGIGDAFDLINENTEVITGTYRHSSAHGSASNNLFIKQSGHVVSINGFVSGLSSLVAGENTIGTFSGVSMPPSIIRAIASLASNAWSNGDTVYCAVGTDGSIGITPGAAISSGKTVRLAITYIAD